MLFPEEKEKGRRVSLFPFTFFQTTLNYIRGIPGSLLVAITELSSG